LPLLNAQNKRNNFPTRIREIMLKKVRDVQGLVCLLTDETRSLAVYQLVKGAAFFFLM
jgi:hypothetical protein